LNDLEFVLRAVDLLASHRVRAWICGGWGEELRGLVPPREHADVDLLYPARDWSRVDALELEWIDAKRCPWRRAFMLDGTAVELFQVDRDSAGWFTDVGGGRHRWPADVFRANGRVPVASLSALAGFREAQTAAANAA
jgi:hypothetical protein